MPGGPGNIIIRVGAETAQAVAGLARVNSQLGDTMSTSEKGMLAVKKAAVPAALALGAIGAAAVVSTKAAMEDAAAQSRLAGQLARTTGASQDQIKAAEDYITKLELQTGVMDDDLRPALGRLATATGDLGLAQKDLQLALDISAQTGKSLSAVTTALAKGYSGNTGAISRLVPGMDKAVLATKDMTQVTAELANMTGGAAAEAADTASGRYAVWQAQVHELEESLGAGLIPVVTSLLGVLSGATAVMADHTTAVKIAVAAVAALSAAILVVNAAIKAWSAITAIAKAATVAWTGVQWLLNAALDANPIGVVIVAVAALTAAIILAYKHSATFRQIVGDAMGAVRVAVAALGSAFNALLGVAQSVWNWITAHWSLAFFALGPIGAALYVLANHFDAVKSAALGAFNAVLGVINSVVGAIESAIGAVESLLSAIGKIHVPSIHIPNPFSLPAPTSSARGVGARSLAVGATAGGGGTTINVYGAIDPEGTARTIMRVLADHERRQGRR